MKSSYLRASVALACALGLSACGGSSGDLLLGGYVNNVTKDGLVLQNNGGYDLAVPAGSATFVFKDLIGVDSRYDVTVKSVPPNVKECTVVNGSGRSAFNVTSVQVNCQLKSHELNGTVIGLTADTTGLEVVNGSDRVAISLASDTDTATPGVQFKMAAVGEDSRYGISILTQPAHRVCTVANGTGTMGTTDVTGVQITCVDSGA